MRQIVRLTYLVIIVLFSGVNGSKPVLLPNVHEIHRLSLSTSLIQPDKETYEPYISPDGRYASFFSFADNLIEGDSNSSVDLFLYDFTTSELSKISKGQGVLPPNTISTPMGAAISLDGKFIAFASYGNDYISGDSNGLGDIYVYDRENNSYERISVASDGTQANGYSVLPAISDDGRFIAFSSSSNNLIQGKTFSGFNIYIHDRLSHTTEILAPGQSMSVSISSDGNFVAFNSNDNTLVNGDIGNYGDVFVVNRVTGEIEIVSVNSVGIQGNSDSYAPSISGDGRFVTFISTATNIVFTGNPNYYLPRIYVHDRLTGYTSLVSLSSSGVISNGVSWHPQISRNGRYITYESVSTNLVSDDQNYYCGNNLLENCRDIFVRDLKEGITFRASTTYYGQETNNNSRSPVISGDGTVIVYETDAFNILPLDTNGKPDIYATVFSPLTSIYIPILFK